MKKILVAVDGSEPSRKALRMAVDIASKMSASITVIHVVTPPYVPPAPYGTGSQALELSLQQYGEHLARESALEIQKAGVEADFRVELGSPPETINATATVVKADMVVVGCRGLNAIRRVMLGSVSDRLTHISQVPVLVVH